MNKTFAAVVGLVALVAGLVGGNSITQLANAAEDTTTDSVETATAPIKDSDFDPAKGGHTGTNGIKEEILTGDVAEKVKSAALEAIDGGTVERVETDAEGAAYEAHMQKSDGTSVTVKFDSNFKVTNTESGMK